MTMNNPMRINKYLSQAGYCSRRQADDLVKEGHVTINGCVAKMGEQVLAEDLIEVDGQVISLRQNKSVYAFYKPIGIISSLSSEQGEGLDGYVKDLERIYPVGRLDKDSHGLMLLTNDGELMNQILKAANGHEKEYLVKTKYPIDSDFIRAMSSGVRILNKATGRKVMTAPCKVTLIDDTYFRIVLIQGMNRQIRRMCEACGNRVEDLQRVRIMNITIEGLQPGELRELREDEVLELHRRMKNFKD